ncbi:unnamed protein product [Parnassius mnemosyne]|uniref:Ion transport domain-containing protein n=1 Tax=Parnassius mnemosyne TaxID=213953 RepID=A0AAV1K8V8_9NEOP
MVLHVNLQKPPTINLTKKYNLLWSYIGKKDKASKLVIVDCAEQISVLFFDFSDVCCVICDMTKDSYEMDSNRITRGGSLFGSDPQIQLRKALKNNDYVTFKKIVSYGAVDLEYVYPYPDYKTCLELALSETDRKEFVKLLLQHEVQINKVNEKDGKAPIHLAVENGNLEGLTALLEDDRIDVNIKCKGNTALLMAIKGIQDLDDNREQNLATYEDMIELLLKAGSNANAPDNKGITPVYSAAKQGLERVVKLILDYSKDPIDLDSYKDIRGRTARYYLNDAFPHLLEKFDALSKQEEIIDIDKLFSYLSRHEEDNFIRDYTKLVKRSEHRPAIAANNGMYTMLQLSTEKGFEKIVGLLLNSGADPNATCSGNITRPIAIACQNGYYKILKMFIDNESTLFDPVNNESLLQITIKGMKLIPKSQKVDFKGCLDLLLKNPKINTNVNYSDIKNNTALHYAARNGDNDTVLELLRSGACIGLRNKFDEPPLADINSKTLETYLDECITSNSERPSDDDYEINIKYSFLVYPNNSFENELCRVPLMDNENNNIKECDALLAPETEALLYMTRNEELRPLLKHPVITSFLYLKWQRISCYGVEREQSKSIEALNVVTHVGAIIGLILLIFRELFQLLVSPTRYLQSIENWMEIALIFVTAWIVGYDSATESTKQQLSAVAILLSSAELVLLIDEDQRPPNPNKTGKQEEDDEEDFFEDPARSLFKTIVMLTGEFDAGSIKFSTFPVTSHIIFIVFVFMVPIVLFNLLNGLAVSDTQEIRADAELVGHISRVKLISYFESVLIGRAYSKSSKIWSWLPPYLQELQVITPKMLCMKPLAKRIKPLGKYGDDYEDIEGGKCCFERCQNYRLERKIVKNAKLVISKKTYVSEFSEIREKLSLYETKIDNIESTLKKVLDALEMQRNY